MTNDQSNSSAGNFNKILFILKPNYNELWFIIIIRINY